MSKKKHVKSNKKEKPQQKVEKHIEHKAEKAVREEKESTPLANEKSAARLRKTKGILLIMIGTLLLAGAGVLLYQRILRPTDLSNYLPQDSTFALVEFDLGATESQDLYAHISKYPVYQKENLTNKINALLNIDYSKDVEPWIGRQIGLALLKNGAKEEEPIVTPVAFVEVKNFNQALSFLQSRKLEDGKDALQIVEIEGESLYQYTTGSNLYLAFIDDYLVIGLEPAAVKNVIKTAKDGNNTLEDSGKYHKIAANLSSDSIVFGYFDVDELTNFILDSPNFVAKNGFILTTFEPFLSIFDAEGFTITFEDKNLQLQTFTSLNKDLLEGKEFLTFKEKYDAGLAKFTKEDAMVVWGGMNLEKQLKRIADILGKGSEASMMIFEGVLEAQKNIYFGQDVSLHNDIYPLINKEFIVALYDAETPQVEVVLELDDEANSLEKIRKIVDGFVKENAVFKPEVREVKLEDGTVGQEIVGVPEEVQSVELEHNGQKLFAITLGSKNWGVYWFVRDKKLFLATQKELIEKVIDGHDKPLNSSELFRSNIQPILSHADEVSYINLQKFLPHFLPTVENGDGNIIQLYTDPFAAISSGKNYFDDGISTIHNIAFK